ncbi:extracellular solute-binding protein [Rhizobium sp. BK251]|uniref:ABC transporter substrate-binding protein n=1 Tax=Rhizobium sp. BK251 TaxID=2512125 RepID=UPI001FE22B27|nr:extracellular solute-binding protein [Rhizobium sp. BK251]
MMKSHIRMGAISKALILGLVAAFATGPALAQSVAEVAAYNGPDRMEKLVEAAKKEGKLTLYTVTPVDDVNQVIEAFTAKYGIPVTLWRGSSEDVLRRAVTEIKAGRHDVDVIETNGPELEALHRENILQAVDSPVFSEIFPGAVPAHREWAGSRLNIITASYNTDLVSDADVPKSWNDLLDPKWSGKIGVESEAYDWLATVVQSFPSKEDGLAFYSKLEETNHPLLVKGHPQLANMTASGELPITLQVYLYRVHQLEEEGAPIKPLSIGPAIARINGLGIAKTTEHPNAAILYQQFTLTDAQKILASRHFTPANTKEVPFPANMEVKVIEPTAMLDDLPALRETFEKTFQQ